MPSKPFLKVGDVVRLSQEGLAAIYTNTAGKEMFLNALMVITEVELTEVPTTEGPAFIVHTDFGPFQGFLLFDWFFRKA